jgi:hypothetical protein
LLHGSRVRIFNGGLGADTLHDIRDNSELVAQTIYEEAISQRPVTVLAPGGSGTFVFDSGKLQSYTPGSFDASTFSGPITLVNVTTRGLSFKAGAGFLGMGVVSDRGSLDATAAPFAWWLPRMPDAAGTKPAPEREAGINDSEQFLREHLMPLRAAQPRPLGALPAGTTDVRLYRVSVDTATTSLRITD